MTFLVTFTFDAVLIIEMLAFQDQLAYILITIIPKSIISNILENCLFCIWGNGMHQMSTFQMRSEKLILHESHNSHKRNTSKVSQ